MCYYLYFVDEEIEAQRLRNLPKHIQLSQGYKIQSPFFEVPTFS